jgi:hypothetical protein
MIRHGEACQRTVHVINLDPAAEHFDYDVTADIRELVHLDDVMEDDSLRFGPNGGLVFCMEYLVQNMDWLEEQLGEGEDDYFLFDCPGQIELYTHLPVMRQLVDTLQAWSFRVGGVFLIDSQFMVESSKFFSGVLTALSTMITLEIPHINVLSKVDLLSKDSRKAIDRYLEPDTHLLLEGEERYTYWGKRYQKLNEAMGKLVDDYSLVKFIPLDIKDEESIGDVMLLIDSALQYGEDLEVKTKDFDTFRESDDDPPLNVDND